MSSKIFVVEDDALTAAQLQKYIEEIGYGFAGAADNALSALDGIRQARPDLVIMDIRLNGAMDGIEAAARLHADGGVGVIYLSAYAEADVLARAKPTEPYGYLVKPFNRQSLQASIEIALYKRETERKQLRLFDGVVHIITELVKLHDLHLNDVQTNAAALAEAIATELELPAREVQGIRLAALLHAVGLLGIPSELLLSRTPLGGARRDHFQGHPETAWQLLKGVEFPYPVAEMVHQHMERLDGSGYPRGLAGAAILPGARILAVACRVARMLTPGVGHVPEGVEGILKELGDGRGTQFDAAVVDACVRLFREEGFSIEQS